MNKILTFWSPIGGLAYKTKHLKAPEAWRRVGAVTPAELEHSRHVGPVPRRVRIPVETSPLNPGTGDSPQNPCATQAAWSTCRLAEGAY